MITLLDLAKDELISIFGKTINEKLSSKEYHNLLSSREYNSFGSRSEEYAKLSEIEVIILQEIVYSFTALIIRELTNYEIKYSSYHGKHIGATFWKNSDAIYCGTKNTEVELFQNSYYQ
jgi:hypothetical protein